MFVLLIAYWAILFSPNVSSATSAKVTRCADAFSNSSDRSVRNREVVETYTSLLRDLGVDLTPLLLKTIHDSGDPFKLPKNVGTSESLRSSLKQFEDILRSHSDDIESYRKLLLTELVKMADGQKSVDVKVKTTLKTKETRFERMIWGNSSMHSVLELAGGWYLGLPSHNSPGRQLLFWHPQQGLTKRSISERDWPEYGVYHPPTKSLYYSRQDTGNYLRARLPIFNVHNDLLLEMKPEPLSLKTLPRTRIHGIEISPDGSTILFKQEKSCFIAHFNGDKLGDPVPFYKHTIDESRIAFEPKFLGNSEVGIRADESFRVYDLSGKQIGNPVPIKKEIFNWSVTGDQKHLFLSYYPFRAQPYGERWDLEKIRKSQPTEPTTFTLGYPGVAENSIPGGLHALLGTPYVMHFFFGEIDKGPNVLRIWDPDTLKIMHEEGIPIKGDLLHEALSIDHSTIRAFRWNYDQTPMFVWRVGPLRELAEAGKKGP